MLPGAGRSGTITAYAHTYWLILTQPLGFIVALIGLMGKLELPPFDAPEAHTEIVAGALTEYQRARSGHSSIWVGQSNWSVGLTLISAFYLGGLSNPLWFLVKTLALLFIIVGLQALLTCLRIDQTVGMWWRYGTLLVLVQWFVMILV